VDEACEGFSDLGVRVSTDLLDDTTVDRACAAALVAALRTVLHNVRRHADATCVVVHGDVAPPSGAAPDDGGRRWTISVGDDGRGFDVDRTPFGVGLGSQVVDQLALHDVETSIRSVPGQGTRVELSGTAGR
jgi:signal transduction histidine kinase